MRTLYPTGYSFNKYDGKNFIYNTKIDEINKAKNDLIDKFLSGDELFIYITHGPKSGSIGKIISHDIDILYPHDHKKNNTYPNLIENSGFDINNKSKIYYYSPQIISKSKSFKATFGKRPNTIKFTGSEYNDTFHFLLDYDGEPFEKEKEKPTFDKIVIDKFGDIINVGDLFFIGQESNIAIGKLTEITDYGWVKYEDFDSFNQQMTKETTIVDNIKNGKPVNKFIKVGDNFKNELVIRRLSKN